MARKTKTEPLTASNQASPITIEVERLMKGHEPELDPLRPYQAASEDHAVGWAMAQIHLLESLLKRVDTSGLSPTVDPRVCARMFLGAGGRRVFLAGDLLTTRALEAKVYEVVEDILAMAEREELGRPEIA